VGLDFFQRALRQVREVGRGTGALAPRHLRGHPSDDGAAVARRDRNRADVPAGCGQPGRILPALAGLGAAPGEDGAARRDPAADAAQSALRLSPDHGGTRPRGLAGQSQAGAAADARGQSSVPEESELCADHHRQPAMAGASWSI
jgi:hypothetical protein